MCGGIGAVTGEEVWESRFDIGSFTYVNSLVNR